MTLPDEVLEEAERLTRLAREADRRDESDCASPSADRKNDSGRSAGTEEAQVYRDRRDDLLAEHGYIARVRSDDTGDVLVCHPAEWLDETGTVEFDAVEDVSRGEEVSLSGTGESDAWAVIDAHNRAVADRVADDHGEVHGRTGRALADFASNHYAKRIERLTPAEREEFRTEYLPRNGWPTNAQREVAEESVALAVAIAASLEERP